MFLLDIPDSENEYSDFYCMLVKTYSDQMFNIALHILRNTYDAQDAVQDSFKSLWKHMQSTAFTPEKCTPQYMHKIVKNAALKLIEKRQKFETSEFTDGLNSEIASYISTSDEYSLHELYHTLLSDICQMKPIYRDVYFCIT